MQIQLVIGEYDKRYLDNLLLFLERNHMEKLEILSFTTPDMLQKYFQSGKADVILIGESFGIRAEDLARYGKVAYLCNDTTEIEKNGVRLISKYKKPDLIFRDILDLYAESGNRKKIKTGNSTKGNFILVTGFSGGTGASTFAAALSMQYASMGKKTLYLNFEVTGSSADFFSGTGNYRLEDVIFALKSQKADVQLKLESSVRLDKSGVHYFDSCNTAMYMLELTSTDILKILDILSTTSEYEYIVIDMNFELSKNYLEIMDRMDRIILVGDGTEIANTKFVRTMQALRVLEEQMKSNVMGVMSVLYNKFSSSKSSNEIPDLSIPVLGKIPPVKHALVNEIINFMLSKQEIFEKLK